MTRQPKRNEHATAILVARSRCDMLASRCSRLADWQPLHHRHVNVHRNWQRRLCDFDVCRSGVVSTPLDAAAHSHDWLHV